MSYIGMGRCGCSSRSRSSSIRRRRMDPFVKRDSISSCGVPYFDFKGISRLHMSKAFRMQTDFTSIECQRIMNIEGVVGVLGILVVLAAGVVGTCRHGSPFACSTVVVNYE